MDTRAIAKRMFLFYSVSNPVRYKEHGFILEWRMSAQTFIELVKAEFLPNGTLTLADYKLYMANQFLGIDIALTGHMDDGDVSLSVKVA